MKTFTATPDDIHHEWLIVDAQDVPLGRLASAVAQLIRGKHKPTFTPHMDGGDFVVVINAEKVRLTGKKLDGKTYFKSHRVHGPRAHHHRPGTCWPSIPTASSRRRSSACCPRRRWPSSTCAASSRCTPGAEHPHAAQQPKPYPISPAPRR